MEARSALVLAVSASLLLAGRLTAQCPQPVSGEGDPAIGYGPRAGGAYCDGQVDAPHGGRLRILSVTVGGSAPPKQSSLRLTLAAPQKILSSPNVTVQGLPLDPGANYRFDAIAPPERFPLAIGPDAALWRLEKVIPGKIGWVAWVQQPGEERIYLPVRVGAAAGSGVEIAWRAAIRVAVVRVRVKDGLGEPAEQSLVMDANPGMPLRFKLPPGPEGIVTIDVSAEGLSGFSSDSLSFKLWRPVP